LRAAILEGRFPDDLAVPDAIATAANKLLTSIKAKGAIVTQEEGTGLIGCCMDVADTLCQNRLNPEQS